MLNARLGALAALALTLVLSACSTNDDLARTTDLEPQFGTRGYDEVTDVAYGKALSLYTVGVWDGVENPEYNLSEYQDAFVRRYDRNGNMLWEKYLDIEPAYENYVYQLNARAVAVDNSGNAIVAWSVDYTDSYYNEYDYYQYEVVATFNYLTKYSPTGSQIWKVKTSGALTDLATDSSNNIYATSSSALIKYTSSGSQSWSRSQAYTPTGVAVSSTNNVYIARYDGALVKFNGSGTQLNLKTGQLGGYGYTYKIAAGTADEVYVVTKYSVSGNAYCEGFVTSAEAARIYKLSNSGVRQWYKDAALYQPGDYYCTGDEHSFDNPPGIASDTLGNVYIAGYSGDYNDQNGFLAKYSRAGALSWKKGFGTPQDDAATAIATYDGSEVFTGGVTNGFLVHRQLGGGGDAIIREVNSSGNLVWAR